MVDAVAVARDIVGGLSLDDTLVRRLNVLVIPNQAHLVGVVGVVREGAVDVGGVEGERLGDGFRAVPTTFDQVADSKDGDASAGDVRRVHAFAFDAASRGRYHRQPVAASSLNGPAVLIARSNVINAVLTSLSGSNR